MKDVSAALRAHLGAETTTLAQLVKISRVDGVVVGMTSHDADLYFEGVRYVADGAFSASSRLVQKNALKTDDFDVAGYLSSAAIAAEDVRKGLYDYARVDVGIVNWADLSQGAVMVRRGWLGEVVVKDNDFAASLRGLHDLLAQKVGATYTPECRFELGDEKCGVALDSLRVSGSVTGVTDARVFMDSLRTESSDLFDGAVLTWVSGANAGARMEVRDWDLSTRTFTLWLPMQEAIAVGDAYSVTPGCDKRFATCRTRFVNGANYGGFPYLPGIGKILDYPEAT